MSRALAGPGLMNAVPCILIVASPTDIAVMIQRDRVEGGHFDAGQEQLPGDHWNQAVEKKVAGKGAVPSVVAW